MEEKNKIDVVQTKSEPDTINNYEAPKMEG